MTARRFGARKRVEEKPPRRSERPKPPPSWASYRPDDGGNPANNRSRGNRPAPGQRSNRTSVRARGAKSYGKRGDGR